jgi:hypothetical protein
MNSQHSSLTHKRLFRLSTFHRCRCTAFAKLQVYPRPRRGVTKSADGCGHTKKPAKNPRARAYRLINRAAKKLAEIPDEHLEQALKTLGKQLKATKPIWEVEKKKMIKIADEKIRQDAAIMILAYKWGKPVDRSIGLHGDADDFPELLRACKHLRPHKRSRILNKRQ